MWPGMRSATGWAAYFTLIPREPSSLVRLRSASRVARMPLLPRCDRPTLVFVCGSAAQRGAGSVRSERVSRTRNGWSGGAVTVRAMHRLLVLYPPPSDPDHFRSYYEDTHLPLVAKFPGLRGYRYSFDVAAGEGESPYYCVFEADFDDAAALSAARESPEGQAVRADVPNYATGGAVVLDYELRAG
jgi:uncharacterized protein (TIGR02118 family)